MYYQPETSKTYHDHNEIRFAMPNALFLSVIDDDALAYVGVFPLTYLEPQVEAGQVAEPTTIEEVGGVWTQMWSVRDATQEELAENEAHNPAPDLDALKAAKNDQINAWRAEANLSTFPHAGKLIACDALSRSDIDGVANNIALFGEFPTGFPGGWKATDNTMIPLVDVDAFRAMYASMTAQGTENFNYAQELKAQLAAASTPEEVAAIEWGGL